MSTDDTQQTPQQPFGKSVSEVATTDEEVEINGIVHTLQLNDEDKERYGIKKRATAPGNKARTADNK
jgi:hypothetical protein